MHSESGFSWEKPRFWAQSVSGGDGPQGPFVPAGAQAGIFVGHPGMRRPQDTAASTGGQVVYRRFVPAGCPLHHTPPTYVISGRGGKGGCTLFAPLRKGDCPLCHAGKGDSPRFHKAGNGCSPLFLASLNRYHATAWPCHPRD